MYQAIRALGPNDRFTALQAEAGGALLALEDRDDGIRVLRINASTHELVKEVVLGAKGDHGSQLVLGPDGAIYLAGTRSSGVLQGTAGVAIPQQPSGTSAFVAALNLDLSTRWFTSTGATRSSATALAANASGVFVAGILFGADLPVTSSAVQQKPAPGSLQNGFIEAFSANGSDLKYATYLTGADGDTTPAGMAVDAASDLWVVGRTTSSGFPTIGALVSEILSSESGFAAQLAPAGDAFAWSTFVPGKGLSSIAIDPSSQALWASGNVSLGGFPVDTVQIPLLPVDYEVLLRLNRDGTAVFSGTVIAPGLQSTVTASPDGSAWVSGVSPAEMLSTVALPMEGTEGDAYSAHVATSGVVDAFVRLGGEPTSNLAFSSLPIQINAAAVNNIGRLVIAGAVQPTASANLLGVETYNLVLSSPATSAFPSTIRDAEQSSLGCTGSLCAGSASFLAEIDAASKPPALLFSVDDAPILTLHNLGSSPATGLTLGALPGPKTDNCASTLPHGADCKVRVSDLTAGSLTLTSVETGPLVASYPAPLSKSESTVAFSPTKASFGIRSPDLSSPTQTVTLSNLSSSPLQFASAAMLAPREISAFQLSNTDCDVSTAGFMSLGPLASCTLKFSFTPSSEPSLDGLKTLDWALGPRQLRLSAYSLAAPVTLSSGVIDFGTSIQGQGAQLRYLYLSNHGLQPYAHTTATIPSGLAFSLVDRCPSLLASASVCRIDIAYSPSIAPSLADMNFAVDALEVNLRGAAVVPGTGIGSTVNPNLSVSPALVNFADPVVVTSTSSQTQTITILNTGTVELPVRISLTGDFAQFSSCPSTLLPGGRCTATVTFTPSEAGSRRGLLTVDTGPNFNPSTSPLSGTAVGFLPVQNNAWSAGAHPIYQPVVSYLKLSQPFEALTVRSSGPFQVALLEDNGSGHGDPAPSFFSATTNSTCRNCWLALRFLPRSTGPQAGSLSIRSDTHGLPYTVQLSGEGISSSGMILVPEIQDFGAIPVSSTSGGVLFSLANSTAPGAAVIITPPTSTNAFLVSAPAGSEQACNGSLDYGASCFFQIAFHPVITGAIEQVLTLSTTAGPATMLLKGLGLADPGLSVVPLALNFVNTADAAATVQSVLLTNTGTLDLEIGTPVTSSASFQPSPGCATLSPRASCSISVSFEPGAALTSGVLSIPVTRQSLQQTYIVSLAGSYTSDSVGMTISPTMAMFGASPTGQLGLIRQYKIVNNLPQQVALAFTIPHGFAAPTTMCSSLAPGAECTFDLQATPLTNGDMTGTVTLSAVSSGSRVPVVASAYAESFGVGSGTLAITSKALLGGTEQFGQVTSGQASVQTIFVTNSSPSGTAPIRVRRIRSPSPFRSVTNCGGTLMPGQTCSVTVTYSPMNEVKIGSSPTNAIADIRLLTIESDSQTSPDTVQLSGLAAPAQVPSPGVGLTSAKYSLSAQSMTFGLVKVGDASAYQETVITNTGSIAMQIQSVVASPGFYVNHSCNTVLPGETCLIAVQSKPLMPGQNLGALEIATDADQTLEFVSLFSKADPSALRLSPDRLDFGTVAVGSSASLAETVTNSTTTPILFKALVASQPYTVTGNCPLPGHPLAGQSSCTLQVAFKPTVAAAQAGVLSIDTDASSFPLSVSLQATGASATLTSMPPNLDFGTIALGSSSVRSLALKNSGSLEASNLTYIVTGDYALTSPCSQPSLTPGGQCTLGITYTPTGLGARPGQLKVSHFPLTPVLVVPLTGEGLPGGGFELLANGGATASATLVQGHYVTFQLSVRPTGGYSGAVALTCLPTQQAAFANCSILPAIVGLGQGPQFSTATVNTVTIGPTTSLVDPAMSPGERFGYHAAEVSAGFSFCALALYRRKSRRGARKLLFFFSATFLTAFLANGCGRGPSLNTHFTPAGSYEFQIMADSTTGLQIEKTVTLTVVITPRE